MSENLIIGIVFTLLLSIPCILTYYLYAIMYKKPNPKVTISVSANDMPDVKEQKADVARTWSKDASSDLKNIVHNIRTAPVSELKFLVECAKIKYRYCIDLFDVVYKEKLINIGREPKRAPFFKRKASVRRNWLSIFIVSSALNLFSISRADFARKKRCKF
ncbi:MAG TPA: hypothetical protein VGP47_01360 [Parachlamydiaceae bacterium]|nr:hypothetical protein [Parachlamydiaceae bacterium]